MKRVRIIAPQSVLPQTLVAFIGRVGELIEWEGEIAVVRFGRAVVLVAAGHLEIVGG